MHAYISIYVRINIILLSLDDVISKEIQTKCYQGIVFIRYNEHNILPDCEKICLTL